MAQSLHNFVITLGSEVAKSNTFNLRSFTMVTPMDFVDFILKLYLSMFVVFAPDPVVFKDFQLDLQVFQLAG